MQGYKMSHGTHFTNFTDTTKGNETLSDETPMKNSTDDPAKAKATGYRQGDKGKRTFDKIIIFPK